MATPNVIRQPAGRHHTQPARPPVGGSSRPWTLTPRTTSASRSRARRRATSTPRSSHCRPTGGGPCARYMRLPAASTTRLRAICATRRSCGCSPTLVPASLGTARHGRSTRCWWRSAMSTDGFRYRSPVSMISSTEPRVTCTAATYDTFEDLVQYCRQVAGSIGRLSVAVLGSRDPAAAAQLADDLGVAMQLTNILRDCVAGLPARARVPPARGLRAVRLSGRSAVGPSRAIGQADPPPGAPKPRVVRPRTRAATAARCPWSGVRRGTGRDPHAPPRAHRALTDRCPARTDLPARTRESPHRGDRAHSQSRAVACRLIGSQQPSGSF